MNTVNAGSKGAVFAALFALLAACSGQQPVPDADPWEGVNRKVFAFNEAVDGAVVKPVAQGYQAVTPQLVDDGISNFFANLNEVQNVTNDLLQGRFAAALNDTARFVINSTVGVLGFFDVASRAGLPRHDQDFGLTLAHWGVDSGPYLVLPVLGPRTVRDAAGLAVDTLDDPLFYLLDDRSERLGVASLRLLDRRADLLKAEQLIAGDRYVFIREAWLQQRRFKITGERSVDDFGDEDF